MPAPIASTFALFLTLAGAGQSRQDAGAGSLQAAPIRIEEARVLAIAQRIGTAATPWCVARAPLPGWALHHLDDYPPKLRDDVAAAYGLADGAGIVAVAPASAAASAGLLPGDVLLAIDGEPLAPPQIRTPAASRGPGTAVERRIELRLAAGPARLTFARGGARLERTIVAPPACPTRIRIAATDQRNAVADGEYAVFSAALVAFAADDAELAVSVAHELAHNYLGHARRRADGSDRRSLAAQEAEADAFALRLLAAAGYDPGAAIGAWQRMLRNGPLIRLRARTHPGKRDRIAALRRELAAMARTPGSVEWAGVRVAIPARDQ